MPIRLFVGNLPYDTSETELKEHFSAVAPVTYLMIPKDRETGRPRNFAFVEFGERAQAEEAVRRLNNQSFNGRMLAVSEARPREEGRSTNSPARPPLSRSYTPAEPLGTPPPPSGDRPNRNFGPDAAPPRRNKGKGAPKSERGPKGPMREVVSKQFVSWDDDDDYADDYDDFDDASYDGEDDHDGSSEDDFAERASGAGREDEE